MSLFFHWISAVFSIYCYHGLSSGVQSISSVSASTFISFYFLVYWNKKIQGSSLLNNALSGAGSDQLPYWNDFVTAIFFPSIFLFFSIIHFSWKWPSRMNNLYRKMPIFVQNRFNRFHHFSIGFTQMSNLLQPFAVGSNQCLAYFMVLSLDFSSCSIYWIFCTILPWFSSVVKSISSF